MYIKASPLPPAPLQTHGRLAGRACSLAIGDSLGGWVAGPTGWQLAGRAGLAGSQGWQGWQAALAGWNPESWYTWKWVLTRRNPGTPGSAG